MHVLKRRFVAVPGALAIIILAGCSGGDSTNPQPTTRTVAVTASGTGGGTVTSSPAGITCGSTCTATLSATTAITLTAAPNANSTFVSWSGVCTGTSTTCTVPAGSTAATATARFDLAVFTLTVALAGTGTGTVTGAPAGIICGTVDCAKPYTAGTQITLTATPAAGSTFTGWSGGVCTGTAPCVVTVNQATTVTATFASNPTLTVALAGNGGGTVTSAPAGINCAGDCTEAYAPGTVVTLTAAANATSTFTGWSGGTCAGTGTCVVTVAQATTITATFALQTRALTVTPAGNGTGTVTSAPAGITCGATCTANFNAGTVVTLTAAPAVSSTFAGWSGAGCTGTGTCVVTLAQASTVTATFTLLTNTLTVNRAGTGAGTVTSTPAGINCGVTCASVFNYGTAVTLVAVSDATSVFAGWTGACTAAGTGTSTGQCVVTTNAAATVTATFSPFQFRWPDSATQYCSDGTVSVACPGGIAGQDGSYALNVPVYEVLGGRIRDSATGLIWERNPPMLEINHPNATTYCDDLVLDGFTDWRLPSFLELLSITDYGRVGPAFETTAFPNIPQNSNFWTSTDRAGTPTIAYGINTNYPTATGGTKSSAVARLVRCVRGTTFAGTLSLAGGSVTDGRTGLIWQSDVAPTPLTWNNAVAYCEALVQDGSSAWRLPSGKELLSIVDVTLTNPSISPLFAMRPATNFWTSSITPNFTAKAYAVDFSAGASEGIEHAFTELRSARCVR